MASLSPALMHRSHLARFGEPVLLPAEAGTREVSAVVDLPGLAPELRQRAADAGARLRIEHQAQPVLFLSTEDAAGLAERDAVTVRAVEYLVVRLTPDGEGLTAVELVRPGNELGQSPELNRWR